jgi:DNA modification methylase
MKKMETDRIFFGDAYELIKKIPDKSVDLIVTDPPYLYKSQGGGGVFGERIRKKRNELNGFKDGFDYSIFDEFCRVEKKINVYVWCNAGELSEIMGFFEKKGCCVAVLCWHKTNPMPMYYENYLLSDTEFCVFARKGAYFCGDFKSRRTFFVSPMNTDDEKDFLHPTIKPLEWTKTMVKNSSKIGEIVFDPFCWSGTMCEAAKETKRKYIGFEKDEKWCKVAVDRLNGVTAKGQTSIFTDFGKL